VGRELLFLLKAKEKFSGKIGGGNSPHGGWKNRLFFFLKFFLDSLHIHERVLSISLKMPRNWICSKLELIGSATEMFRSGPRENLKCLNLANGKGQFGLWQKKSFWDERGGRLMKYETQRNASLGNFGWQAADRACNRCFHTCQMALPNGEEADPNLENNPLVIAIPRKFGSCGAG